MSPTHEWIGASGTAYTYFIHDLSVDFSPNQKGNYIYAKKPKDKWVPVYIGEGDLKDRRENHHKAECIANRGATHFHEHLNEDEKARKAEESDLLANHPEAYEPTGCNVKIGG